MHALLRPLHATIHFHLPGCETPAIERLLISIVFVHLIQR